MLASGPVPVPTSRSPVRTRRTAAWLCSIAFHLLVVYFAGRAAWPVVESEQMRATNVVWLEDIRLPEPEAELEARSEPEPEREPEPEPEEAVSERESENPAPATDSASVSRDRSVRSQPVVSPGEAEVPEAQASEEGEPGAVTPEEADEGEPSRNYIVREVDWEEERRRAVEQVGEALAQERSYRTFSLDDFTEEAVPEEPGPAEDIFSASSGRGGGPSLLTPGRSTGPIARRLTPLCDVLGGISLFGLVSICAEAGPEATLFAHLKPAYLLSRPVCTEVPGTEAMGSSGSGEPAVKCRLVPKDELTAPGDAVPDAVAREDPLLLPAAADASN